MLTPNASKTKWTETVLYSFCPPGQPHCTDGAWPQSGLIMDKSGNLYGTTTAGGIYPSGSPLQFGGGTVFELIPNASRTKWTEKVLHSFCSQGGANCIDGAVPPGGVIIDSSGSLYGATGKGGAYATVPGRGGTVFQLIPNATKTTWTEKVLHSFCQRAPCLDGINPTGGLIMEFFRRSLRHGRSWRHSWRRGRIQIFPELVEDGVDRDCPARFLRCRPVELHGRLCAEGRPDYGSRGAPLRDQRL